MAADPRRVKRLFAAALELTDPSARHAFLERECAGDGELRGRLEELLQAHDRPQPALDQPLAVIAPAAVVAAADSKEQPGTVLAGRYRLLERIGEGGMGSVWMAQQHEPVRRTVAVRKQLGKAGMLEILRVIREEEPPRPSVKLSSDHTLPSLAANRGVEPARLTRLLRGEIDWIVMKALEKERSRRYETANGLAADIQRYLADEPVVEGPPSAGYRLRKFVKRNKGPVLAASLVLLALLAGVVGTTVGLVRAEAARGRALAAAAEERKARQREFEQRRLAEKETRRAEDNARRAKAQKEIADAVRSFFQERLLRQADATAQSNALLLAGGGFEVKENPTVRELLDRTAAELTPKKIAATFPGQPEVQAAILRTVGDTYHRIGANDRAIGFLTRARDLYRQIPEANQEDVLHTLHSLARAYHETGKLRQAIALVEQLREDTARQWGADHSRTVTAMNNLGLAQLNAGEVAEATALFERVRDARIKKAGADHRDTLTTQCNLALAYHRADRLPEAIALFEQVRATQVKTLGPHHLDTLRTLHNLAFAYRDAGERNRAIALLEQVREQTRKKLGADNPKYLATTNGLAELYRDQGKFAEAETLFQEILQARTARFGADHLAALDTRHALAGVYQLRGDYAQAETLIRDVLQVGIATKRPPEDPFLLTVRNTLAELYRQQGKYARAERLFREVLAARVSGLGADHLDTLRTKANLADLYRTAGQTARAEPLLKEGYEGMWQRRDRIAEPVRQVRLAEALGRLVRLYEATGREDEAARARKEIDAARSAPEGTKE